MTWNIFKIWVFIKYFPIYWHEHIHRLKIWNCKSPNKMHLYYFQDVIQRSLNSEIVMDRIIKSWGLGLGRSLEVTSWTQVEQGFSSTFTKFWHFCWFLKVEALQIFEKSSKWSNIDKVLFNWGSSYFSYLFMVITKI